MALSAFGHRKPLPHLSLGFCQNLTLFFWALQMMYLQMRRWVLVGMVCWMAGGAHAEPVQLVSGNDYAPYAGSKLPEGGLATDLVKKAFAQVGMPPTVAWMAWPRGYAETMKGTYAATFPYTQTEERSRDMLFSNPIVSLQMRLFVKSGKPKFDFASTAGFVGSTLCLSAGSTVHPKLLPMFQNGQLKRVAPRDTSVCVQLVHDGLADFFVMEERVGLAAVSASGLAPGAVVVADVEPLSSTELYLMAPKQSDGSKNVIAKFNQGLEELRKNGTYDALVQAHRQGEK